MIVSACIVSGLMLSFVAAQQPVPQKAVAPPQNIRVMGGAQIFVNGQMVVGGQPDPSKEAGNQRMKLPVDPRARRKIEEAKRFIETQDWQNAVKILQSLLNATEDNFLQESDGDKGRRVSVRAEVNRMLGSLPPEGKRFYEQQFGSEAKVALKQAKANANPQSLAEVALKYVHTDAGAEAAAWLGAYHLDHGRYIVSALCYERLLSRDKGGVDLPLSILYKAALAFERAGDAANRERVWKLIQVKLANTSEKLPTAIRSWDEDRLKNALKTIASSRNTGSQNDWRLFMGSPDRTARSNSTAPFLEPRFPAYTTVDPGQARNEIDQASKKLFSMGIPVIPGGHPLIVHDLVIFRALDGLQAYDLKTGTPRWKSESAASLVSALKNNGDPESATYLASYRETAPAILVENTLLGTLSADQELVYAVEDLALPPNVQNYGVPWGRNFNRGGSQLGSSIGDFGSCNHLIAYDLEGGRAVWSIGTRLPDQPFTDMYFLGPPLPLGDKLYVLAEVNSEIKLLCLQNRRTLKTGSTQGDDYEYGVDLVWSQPLGVVDRKISEDPVRRSQAAILSYSDGILVCPTNAGSVIGVDLLTRSLVWAYSYQNEVVNTDTDQIGIQFRVRGRMPEQAVGLNKGSQWAYTAPVVSQGKVLLAPSDGTALHCINLRDGTLAWTLNRIDVANKDPLPPDYYLAGAFDDKVILIGKQNVHAVDLNTGKPLWNTMTGMPCGRGIANEDTYFLPVRGNEIVSLSLKTGQITARGKARHKELLGNLALIGEYFVSLNHSHLLVYPIQIVKEQQVAQRLKANPNDPVGLIDRGELRWHRGEAEQAIEDFRVALSAKPAPELKSKGEVKLADSILGLLEKNFIQYEKYLPELEKLTVPVRLDSVSGDERASLMERKARYYRILANGREAQGRIDEALASLQAFGQLDDKIIISPEDPLVRVLPRVWAQAQAQLMAKRLSPEHKTKLDAFVKKQLEQMKADKSVHALRAFVDFYGELNATGQHAQLLYAETLIDNKEYAEALLRLLPLAEAGNAEVSAKAYDALARLNMRIGEMENAAYYFRLLAHKHPKVRVREGKTGLQLYQELMTDKRFLPYLDERLGLSNLQNVSIEKLAYDRKYSNGGQGSFVTSYEAKQELPPQLRRFSLQVISDYQNSNRSGYVIRDLNTQKEVLSKPNFAQPLVASFGFQSSLWPHYLSCGNVMVFAWSNRIVGVNPLKKKEIWSINVLGEGANNENLNGNQQVMPHVELPGRFQANQNNGTWETLGTFGPGSSRRLVITIRQEGMICIDPQTGERLWAHYGIPAGVEMFGDDDYVIVIPPKIGKYVEDQVLAVRMLDGQATVLNKKVEEQFRSAVAVSGRRMLLRKAIGADSHELSLFDPISEETIWKKTLVTRSTILKSALPAGCVGTLHPDGKLSIVDMASGVPQFETTLQLGQESYVAAHFILDERECYVFLCKQMDRFDEADDRWHLFPQMQWLRSIPLNGPVVALQRDTGKVLWQENVPLQYLVVQRFHELPVLLCSAVIMKSNQPINAKNPQGMPMNIMMNRGNSGKLQNELALYSKQTGKAVPLPAKNMHDPNVQLDGRINSSTGYQELVIETQTGKLELKSALRSVSMLLVPNTLTVQPK
ncbi:MAG TPA: PQQ-binding-like beta-propeller repeat protein [Gemmatales bacterium]|nr:PQQ-binding-like beta-propeller repeat protein [Gemmatales bacterium]